MRLKAADVISKYRILFAAEILILAALGLFLIFKKSYSFSLCAENLVYTTERPAGNYVSYSENGLLRISVPEDEKADSVNLCIWQAYIPFGIFRGEIKYSTVYDHAPGYEPLVSFVTFDDAGDTGKYSDDILLYDHKTCVDFRIYSGFNSGSFHSFINLKGSGDAVIESVTVKEYMPWRVLVFLCALMLFLIADFVIILFPRFELQKKTVFALLTLLTIVVSLPYFSKYSLNGHDIQFHMYRVGTVAEELMHGHFPVRYMSGAYNGFGYIIHILYGNILLIPSALLYALGAPLYVAYNFCLFTVNLLTVIISYYSFKNVFGNAKWGVAGTYIYTVSMYRICDQYIRSDVGEAFAMAFLPLVIYGVYKIYSGEKKTSLKDCFECSLPLVIGISGIIQSHILSTILIGFMILLFCILALPKTIRHIKELLFTVFSVLIINLFYLVPVFFSYVGNKMASTEGEAGRDLKGLALFTSQIFDLFFVPGTERGEKFAQGDMFFGPGLVATIGLILFVVCTILISVKKTKTSGHGKFGMVCLLLALIPCFISSVLFPWEAVQNSAGMAGVFKIVQFPWRFMEMADPLLCFASVSGFVMLSEIVDRKRFDTVVLTCVLLISTIICFVFTGTYKGYAYRIDIRDNYVSILPDWTIFPEGYNRFTTYDTGINADADVSVVRCLAGEARASDAITYEVLTERDDIKNFRIVNGAADTTVYLPVYFLDNMVVRNDISGEKITFGQGDDGRISVLTGSGVDARISVSYRVPIFWKICDIISLIWICIIFCLVYRGRAKSNGKENS